MVSPATGMRGVCVTRSMLREPRMRMWGRWESEELVGRGGGAEAPVGVVILVGS